MLLVSLLKNVIFRTVSFLNWIVVGLKLRPSGAGSRYYLFRARVERGNACTFSQVNFCKVDLQIRGHSNAVTFSQSLVDGCRILIDGTSNRLEVAEDVILRGVTIQIRGSACSVRIGRASTFGGARIVTVGKMNHVIIGEDCLFSDQIEIWSSDTHDIIGGAGNVINPPRDIIIGNHVWVGAKASILKGVTIGDGSVIGFGSIITKNVPAGVACAGCPQKVLKTNIAWRRDEER